MALQFFLTYRGVKVGADEPALDWQSIARILKKSEKFAGITYLVTSELEFANNFVNILDQIKSNGIAQTAILEIQYQNTTTREWEKKFSGIIDLVGSVKTISTTGLEKYKVNTKPTGFEVDFDNNFDVKVNVTDNKDLFGNVISSFSKRSEYIKLKSLSIKQRLDIENEIPNLYDSGSGLDIDADPTNYVLFWNMHFGVKTKQEFGDDFHDLSTIEYDDTSFHPDESLTNEEIILNSPHSPINNSQEILKITVAGDYRIQFSYSLDYVMALADAPTAQILRYRYVMMVAIVNRADPLNPTVSSDILNEDLVIDWDLSAFTYTKTASIDKMYSLDENDEVYIFPYLWLRFFNSAIGVSTVSITISEIDFTVLSLKIDGATKFEETVPQAYLIHELFSRLVNKITGQYDKFQSDFYGRTDSEPRSYAEDGEGSLTAVLGGTHLRGWTVGTLGGSQRSLNLSFAELFESEKAKHNIDVGIIDSIVRIEKAEFFVDKDNASVDLGCIREMEIQTEPKSFYNEIEIGYSQWKNSENKNGAGLQEFNAKVNYAPQLSVINSKYLAVSEFVAAGYTIETTRRQQRYLDTEKETEYDLKTFMIALLRRPGDGSQSSPNYINETWDPLDAGNPWQLISGVDFPEEVYNVRWQPARMVRNHGNKIRLSVQQNSNDELLSLTEDGNSLFSSQLKIESNPVTEGEDIAGIDLGDALYTGQKFVFTTAIIEEQIESINNNPYYHITFTDAKGNGYKGVIEGELSLPFETNLGEFTLKEIE